MHNSCMHKLNKIACIYFTFLWKSIYLYLICCVAVAMSNIQQEIPVSLAKIFRRNKKYYIGLCNMLCCFFLLIYLVRDALCTSYVVLDRVS